MTRKNRQPLTCVLLSGASVLMMGDLTATADGDDTTDARLTINTSNIIEINSHG